MVFIASVAAGQTRGAGSNDYPGMETTIVWSLLNDGTLSDLDDLSPADIGNTSNRGVYAAVASNPSSWFGVVTEGGFNFLEVGPNVDAEIYTVMAGPKFTLRQASRIAPFLQFLAGATYSRLQIPSNTASEWNFGLQPGGGVDLVLAEPIAIRLGLDWRTLFAESLLDPVGDTRNQLRFTLGVTIRSAFR